MDISWRTVQFFLEKDWVAETEIDSENPQKVRCNCPQFSKSARCKHAKWVRERTAENGGHYPLVIPADVGMHEVAAAVETYEGFRDFVLKHNKVRVIA